MFRGFSIGAAGALALALVLCLTATSACADTLSGRVIDSQGLAVANARIKLLSRTSGEQRNTVSGADGRFTFPGLAPGTYVVEAEAANAALLSSEDVSVAGDKTLDLTLKVAATQTEVLVTASNTTQSLTEVAKAVDIVDAEQMNRRNVFQISEALRLVPGLQIQTLEGPGSLTSIQTRGLRNADTAILIDGLRFQDSGSPQNDPTGFLGDLMTTDTERIEVMRGSGSALYGSSAMGGVINIVSRSGGGPLRGEARAEGGGLGLFRGVAGAGGGLANDRVNYSGTVSYVNVADGVRSKSPYRNTSSQGSIRFAATPRVSLTGRIWGNSATVTSTESPAFTPAILANTSPGRGVATIPLPDDQLELFEQNLPIVAGTATYIPSQIDPDARRRSSFVNGAGTLQHVLSDTTTYRIAYQGVDTRRGYDDGPLGPAPFDPPSLSTSHFNGRIDTFQARFDHRAGSRNFLTAGYEFMRESYIAFDDTPSSETRTAEIDLKQNSHSLYAQDQISFGQLQLTFAGRIQTFNLQQPDFGAGGTPYDGTIGTIDVPHAVTGDASAAYFVAGSQTKVRFHAGNSYRAPSSYERFGGGFGSYYGDPRLEPERSVSVDGGVDQWLFGSRVQIRGTIFWTNFLEMIRFENTLPAGDPFGRFFGYANGGRGSASGFELGVQVSPTKSTRAQFAYTYADSTSETPTFGSDYFRVLGTWPQTFAFSITQFVTPQFHATFDLYTKSDYNQTMFGATGRLFQFDGATKSNLVLGYDIPFAGTRAFEVYTKIENLFDKLAYEDGYLGPGRWAVVGGRIKF